MEKPAFLQGSDYVKDVRSPHIEGISTTRLLSENRVQIRRIYGVQKRGAARRVRNDGTGECVRRSCCSTMRNISWVIS